MILPGQKTTPAVKDRRLERIRWNAFLVVVLVSVAPMFLPSVGAQLARPRKLSPDANGYALLYYKPNRSHGSLPVYGISLRVLEANLKLTPAQRRVWGEIQQRGADTHYQIAMDARNAKKAGTANPSAFQARYEAADRASDRAIRAMLTNAQRSMLRRVMEQLMVLESVGIPSELIAELKLTPSQVARLRTLFVEHAARQKAERARIGGSGKNANAMNRHFLLGFRTTYHKALLVLTPKQSRRVTAYVRTHPDTRTARMLQTPLPSS